MLVTIVLPTSTNLFWVTGSRIPTKIIRFRIIRKEAMLNPFVYQYLSENPLHSDLEPKIPVNLATQYSQAGEDLIVQSLVYRLNYFLTKNHRESFNLEDLRYLEIGANHPVATSSTFLFYSRGAKGILVEPNPSLAKYLRIARPNDEIYEIACVDDNTAFGDLYLSEASELSSLVVESPNRWINEFDIKETIKVSTKHINQVAEYFWNVYGKSTTEISFCRQRRLGFSLD